jgi:hypothetical protein
MSWFGKNRKRLEESYDALEQNLTQNNRSPLKGFNDEAKKLRGGERGRLKKTKKYGEQILEEESQVINFDCSKFESSELGEKLAKDVVNEPFWKKLF